MRCSDPDPKRIRALNTSQTLFTVVHYSTRRCNISPTASSSATLLWLFLLDEDLELDLKLDLDWFERSAPDPDSGIVQSGSTTFLNRSMDVLFSNVNIFL